MTNLAFDTSQERDTTVGRQVDARPIPRITIQAFCDTPEIAGTFETAAMDRRMARAHVKVHTGGVGAAAEFYRTAPTPNLIVVESRLPVDDLIASLDSLAEVFSSSGARGGVGPPTVAHTAAGTRAPLFAPGVFLPPLALPLATAGL